MHLLLRFDAGSIDQRPSSFSRAGHAHAGVLVILGLVIKILTSTDGVPALAQQLSDAVLYAAILMPAGFFLSVTGRDPQSQTDSSSCCGLVPPRSPSV